MASYIKTLKEDNGDITYPQTLASAVFIGNSDVETELGKYVTAEDIASTSALTPPVTTSMIADGAVTTNKIDWTTVDFNNLYYPGKLLVTARNITTLSWSGAAAVWTNGTWSQYGPMAQSGDEYRLKITNSTNKTMTVLLELSCPTVNVPDNTYASTQMWEVSSSNAMIAEIGNGILSALGGTKNIWAPVLLRKVVTVAAGATRYFAPAVYRSGTGTVYWYGGDTTTSPGDTGFAGDSCMFTATLMDLS